MSCQTDISPAPLPIKLPTTYWPVREQATRVPEAMAIVLGVTGTLSGKSSMVMADEGMARGMAGGFMAASNGALRRCDVVRYDEIPENTYDSLFVMHHTVLHVLPPHARGLPKWAWIHNAGISTPIALKMLAFTEYQRIFHAGRKVADSCGFDYLPHAIESIDMFHPDPSGDTYDVGFVGNACMHDGLNGLLLRLVQDGKRVEVRGDRWAEAGVPSAGRISMDRAWEVLARSSVCIDHVSQAHAAEGMTSTRIYQVMACESALVSTQDPSNVPEAMRRHAVFVRDMDEAYSVVRKLLADPVARAKIRTGARRTVLRETMLERARTVWARIISDVS